MTFIKICRSGGYQVIKVSSLPILWDVNDSIDSNGIHIFSDNFICLVDRVANVNKLKSYYEYPAWTIPHIDFIHDSFRWNPFQGTVLASGLDPRDCLLTIFPNIIDDDDGQVSIINSGGLNACAIRQANAIQKHQIQISIQI